MADSERNRRLEHAHETKHLSYGHFGTATYDHESRHAWRFLRRHGDHTGNGPPRNEKTSFAPKSRFRLLHQRVARPYEGPQRINGIDSAWIQSRRPIHAYRQRPELAFVHPDLLNGQAGTEAALSHGNAAVSGRVLSCGQAFGLDIRGHRQGSAGATIVASPVGVAQENLWISSVGTDTVPVDDGSGFESTISVPITANHVLQYNLASAEPILQVCFTAHRSIVGIRKASSLTLLHVLWLGGSQQPRMSSASTAAIRIDEILVLPMSRTGGYSHAHLAFNPRDESQLATVDVHGVWSVWSLTDKGKYSTKVSCHARLNSSSRLLPHGSLPANRSPQDGWHLVCWLNSMHGAGEDLLLACSRQAAAVFSVSGEMLGEVDMRIGVKIAKDYILDVQQCSNHSDICFLLTSTRILVMQVAEEVFNNEVHLEPLTLMCSWDHFRGQQDTTLRMSVLELIDSSQRSRGQGTATTMVQFFIFSQRNKDVTRYTLTFTTAVIGGARTISVSEPSSFRLPEVILKHRSPVSDMVCMTTSDEHTAGNLSSGPGTLITLLARMNDGIIFEAVYDYTKPHGIGKLHPELGICLPIRPKMQNQRIASSKYVDDDDDMDNFLVEDSCERVGYGDSRQNLERGEGKSARAVRHKPRAWVDVLPGQAVDDTDADFNKVLDTLGSALSNKVSDPGRLLVEKIPTARVNDVERASEALAHWTNDTSINEPRTDEARLFSVFTFTSSPRLLLEQYNDLIDKYVASLPADTPDRLRVNIERLSRAAALETFLASYILQQNRHTEAEMLRESTTAKNFNDEVKVSGEATEPMPVDKSPLSHLSKYTIISKGTPQVLNMKATTDVLGHLPMDINTDPSDYSYRDAELQLAMARNRLDTDLDPEAKRHAEKLARYEKKKLERERRQAEDMALQQAMKPNQVMSSQLPQAGSSQLGRSQVMNSTQPERGTYGARQRLLKAGKKRLAGF